MFLFSANTLKSPLNWLKFTKKSWGQAIKPRRLPFFQILDPQLHGRTLSHCPGMTHSVANNPAALLEAVQDGSREESLRICGSIRLQSPGGLVLICRQRIQKGIRRAGRDQQKARHPVTLLSRTPASTHRAHRRPPPPTREVFWRVPGHSIDLTSPLICLVAMQSMLQKPASKLLTGESPHPAPWSGPAGRKGLFCSKKPKAVSAYIFTRICVKESDTGISFLWIGPQQLPPSSLNVIFPLFNFGTVVRCRVLGWGTLPSRASLLSGTNEYQVG